MEIDGAAPVAEPELELEPVLGVLDGLLLLHAAISRQAGTAIARK